MERLLQWFRHTDTQAWVHQGVTNRGNVSASIGGAQRWITIGVAQCSLVAVREFGSRQFRTIQAMDITPWTGHCAVAMASNWFVCKFEHRIGDADILPEFGRCYASRRTGYWWFGEGVLATEGLRKNRATRPGIAGTIDYATGACVRAQRRVFRIRRELWWSYWF